RLMAEEAAGSSPIYVSATPRWGSGRILFPRGGRTMNPHSRIASSSPVDCGNGEAALTSIVDAFAERVASRVLELVSTSKPATRVALRDVTAHGAPSARWVVDRARRGEIHIRGPRGARYVEHDELARLIADASIAKRPQCTEAEGAHPLADDVAVAVAALS